MGNELNNKTYTINENCVEIRANDIGIAPVLYAIYYGEKISNLYDLRDNTNNWLKFPVILKSSGDVDKDKKNATNEPPANQIVVNPSVRISITINTAKIINQMIDSIHVPPY